MHNFNDVGRILASAKDMKVYEGHESSSVDGDPHNLNNIQGEESRTNGGHISHFLPTSRRIVQFSNGGKVHLTLTQVTL